MRLCRSYILMQTPVPHSATHPITPEAFASRFEASARVLWTIAAAILGSRGHEDDVLQEAAMIGLQKLDQFQPGTRFDAWMGRIVRYVALNHLRLRSRRQEVGDQALAGSPARTDPRGEDLEPFDDELLEALSELRPIVRACLLLKVVAELEYKQIALSLDLPEGTAMSHVHRARKLLRERLTTSPMGAKS